MNHIKILNSKRLKALTAFTLIALACVFIDIIFYKSHPLLSVFGHFQDSYLLATEKFADLLIHISGNHIFIINHNAILNNVILTDFIPELRYQKICILVLFIIWITKAPILPKFIFSAIVMILHFSFVSIYILAESNLFESGNFNPINLSIPHTIALLAFITILFLWYLLNKNSIIKDFSKIKVNPYTIKKKATPSFIVICLYIIVSHFLLVYFDYHPWINFLFTSAHKILALFGVDSVVEPSLLIGQNGSIYMAKYCLGFKTMFLFAAIVYLTGNNKLTQWAFIVLGIIFLNIINIIRFVLLFIHIQKNGGYALAIDLHNLYNLIVYIIVFALWIIWFEKFSDIKFR